MRNVKSDRVEDKAILEQPMTLATADFKVAGRDRRHRPRR